MKRLFACCLALLLLLSGCGVSSAETAPTAPTVPFTVAPTVPQTEPMTTIPTETNAPVILQPEPADSDFVRVQDYLPTARQELAYATENNFTGQPIYEFTDAWLRYGTLKKLMTVSDELAEQGLVLLIWDGFRPVSAQFRLWEICPDPTYVANPETGYSSHSRGNTIDLTLADRNGIPLEMPTGFDDFSPLADRDYTDCSETAAANALLLQQVMEAHGFTGYFGEWWHFSDRESYPVEELFTPVCSTWRCAECNEFISLRIHPDTSADTITRIPKDAKMQLLAQYGDFGYVEYQQMRGYVLLSYTKPVDAETEDTLWHANNEE